MDKPLSRAFPVGGPNGLVPEIYFGDRFWSDAMLQPDAATYAQITELLGLASLPQARVAQVGGASAASSATAISPSAGPTPRVLPDELEVDPEQQATPYRLSRLELNAHRPIVIPKIEGDVPTLEAETPVSFQSPSIAPLFEPGWTRGILSAALATNSGDGPMDVAGLVNLLAAGKAIQEIPRLPVPTLRRGVQLLLDLSESMLPYDQDLEVLQSAISDVVGQERVQVLRFSGDLLSAGIGPRFYPQPYVPPPPGTVIVLLTDLAISRSWLDADWVGAERWAALADLARQAQCPLVVFVPYSEVRWPRNVAERWPSNLERRMTIIRWDRSTTAGTVRRLIGIAHEVQS